MHTPHIADAAHIADSVADAVIAKACNYLKRYDAARLRRAYKVASHAHRFQKRRSNEPYITHPCAVAEILTQIYADQDTLITAFLHDTVEDTDVSLEDIAKEFGSDVAGLVNGVTKISRIELQSDHSRDAENFRKFVLALTKDLRVLLVKLADRLHNMRTLHHIEDETKKKRIASETLDIFAPLAEKIGIQKFREELENLSFKFLNPQAYALISENLANLNITLAGKIKAISDMLASELAQKQIKASIHYRIKTPYSINKKMQKKKVAFGDLADIYALRVITENKDDCYRVLGHIHQRWPMIHKEFDDYISAPKPNGYQSIHTAVLALPLSEDKRQKLEIQIRSKDMHIVAESGIASHYLYKDRMYTEEGRGSKTAYDWAVKFIDILQEDIDLNEAFSHAKAELYQDQVFCFTPNGEIIALPVGASPLDFAYALHSDIGDSCIGAKINNVMSPLRTRLQNGDVIEILRTDSAPVPHYWENTVITGRARNGIKRRIKKMKKEEQVKLGKTLIEATFAALDLDSSEKALRAGMSRMKVTHLEELYRLVGSMHMTTSQVVSAIYPGIGAGRHLLVDPSQEKRDETTVIEGVNPGVSVTLSPCCAPLPGERIIGIRDDENKLFVHSMFCDRLEAFENHDNWVDLKWKSKDERKKYQATVHLVVTMVNVIGVLSDVTKIAARYRSNISNIRLIYRSDEFVDALIEVGLSDIQHLTNMTVGLRALATVVEVQRPIGSQWDAYEAHRTELYGHTHRQDAGKNTKQAKNARAAS